MSRALVFLLLLWLLQPAPQPPVATWTAPGTLLVSFSGGCLFYARPGYQPAYISCDSPAELRRIGDGAYWPFGGGELSVRDGFTTKTALVPPEPLWYRYFFPSMAMAP